MIAAAPNGWIDYWQTLPPGRLLFSPEADEFAKNLQLAVPLNGSMRVLDYGCGYGAVARLLAPIVQKIDYWDAAESMRNAATRALGDLANVECWDGQSGQFDLIIVNSVVQYMSAGELSERLSQWRELLAPGGRLLLSDLIPTSHRGWSDVASLLSFSLRRGYFFTALKCTLAERRRYDRTAAAVPLFHIDVRWLEETAANVGYALKWLPKNLTHFRSRRSALLTRIADERHTA
jgi:SAM-dependent methyltransferase